jgi:insulysin
VCYNQTEVNADSNENSAVIASFQHTHRSEHRKRATFILLQVLLKEQVFNQLRTQEQLGYIVQLGWSLVNKIMHMNFIVQSSHKGPDYLEHRINNFLHERRNWVPDETKLTEAKEAIINQILQKHETLGAEANSKWRQIMYEETNFDSQQRDIRLFSEVTVDDVKSLFDQLFFTDQKRLNTKISSKQRAADDNTEAQRLNAEFYKAHGI